MVSLVTFCCMSDQSFEFPCFPSKKKQKKQRTVIESPLLLLLVLHAILAVPFSQVRHPITRRRMREQEEKRAMIVSEQRVGYRAVLSHIFTRETGAENR